MNAITKFNWKVILLITLSLLLLVRIISDIQLRDRDSIFTNLSLSSLQVEEIYKLRKEYEPKLAHHRDQVADSSDKLTEDFSFEVVESFLEDYFALQRMQFTVSFEINNKLDSSQKKIFENYLRSQLHREYDFLS